LFEKTQHFVDCPPFPSRRKPIPTEPELVPDRRSGRYAVGGLGKTAEHTFVRNWAQGF
jgi:hypothetical protein